MNTCERNQTISRLFHSKLSENDWTNDDYNKAKQIWKHFDIKNMGGIMFYT